ncbi:MAG: hypothetical protein J0M07_03380 [Anaerolineae bacterium]|nr:hypothetical protein [Anaerolineae bacterium]
MIRALIGEVPTWARRDHPMLRYELGKSPEPRRSIRLLRALGVVLLFGVLAGAGYLIATNMLTQSAGQTLVESLHYIAYFPLIFLQFAAGTAAFTMTADVVGEELRRQNWDNLRATANGAEIALRARWFAVFFRLRGLIGVLVVSRVILIGLILYELTAFQGRYLDLLTFGITPEVALPVAVVLLAFMMTAAFLLPLTGMAFDAALGLLVSAYVHKRTFSTLAQFLVILARFGVMIGLLLAARDYLAGALTLSDPLGWLLMWGLGGAGDQGLAYLLLSRFAEVWATVPYGIFLGLALIGFAFLQAWLAEQVLHFAVRRAQRG